MTASTQSTVSVAEPEARPRRPRVGRAAVLAAVVAALVVGGGLGAAVLSGVLDGPALLVVTVLVGLAVPTSRELARRVAYAGSVALGFAPMVWLVALPEGTPRIGLGVAALAAGLAAWVALDPAHHARRLLPRWRAADALLALPAGWAAISLASFLRPGGGERALALLQIGWDHSAHYSIAAMIRDGGALVSQQPVGQFGEWSYAAYPQGYHAATASVMEVLGGPRVGTTAQEVVLYDRGMALVLVMALVTVVAALLALPALRRRPLVAAPVVVLLAAAFLEGPGGRLLVDGFPNFIVGVALLAALPLLVVPLDRPLLPVPLAAVGGAALGVAHNWIMLLPIAAAALVVLVLPLRRRRWPQRGRDWVAPGLIGLLTVLGVLHAYVIVRPSISLEDTLVIPGGIAPVPIGTLVTLLAASLAMPLLGAAVGRRPAGLSRGGALRTGGTVLMMVAGIALGTGVALLQQERTHQLSYYFWKLAVAVELLGVAVIAVGVAAAVGPRVAASVGSRIARTAGVVVLCVAVSQAFGVTIAGSGEDPPEGASSGAESRQLYQHTEASAGTAFVLAAASAAPPGQLVALVPYPDPAPVNFISAAQWVNALNRSWTNRANTLAGRVADSTAEANAAFAVPGAPTPEEMQAAAVLVARDFLDADSKVRVLVAPQFADGVRAAVPDPERVLSW